MLKKRYITCICTFLMLFCTLNACTLNKQSASSIHTKIKQFILETVNIDQQENDFTYYDLEVQRAIQQQIDAFKTQAHSFESPLLIMNPYGTNTTGLYVYFTSDEPTILEVEINADNYPSFTKQYEATAVQEHEVQVIGLVADVENEVTFTLLNEQKEIVQQEIFTIQAPQLQSGYVNQIDKQNGTSNIALEDGLFVTFGFSDTYNGYSFLIDNDGVIRGEFCLEDDMNENLVFYEKSMLLSVNLNKMARVNQLGKVVAVYDLGEYEIHHDFQINEQQQAVILVSDSKKDSVEDVIITLDLETSDIQELVDFDDVMFSYKVLTQSYSEDSLWGMNGNTSWDWLHFNTLQLVGEDEMILSSRETSTIMKFSNIYDNITIDYFIGDDKIWQDTEYEDKLLSKIDSFSDTAGQHSVTLQYSDELSNGQYYLYMFNNNFWSYDSRINFDYVIEGSSLDFLNAEYSYYTCYLVDEKAGTYTLTERMPVPYSSIVSSVQWYGDNLIVNSGTAKLIQVYDEYQNLIASFDYDNEDLFQGYRVFKYNFKDFWFY